MKFNEKKKKKQKAHKISHQDSSGNIPSIEVTKEHLECADYISDQESEYQEGESSNNNNNNGRMVRRNSTVPPSSLPSSSSSFAQHHQQSPQHQYHQQHQPQVNISHSCCQKTI